MKAHVLLVEDNALVISALSILLENAGFRVSAASRLAEAVTLCSNDWPDVVLLDLRLPDGDGLALFAHLKERGVRMPIVAALTGRDEPEVRARCLEAGCIDVLVKPVNVRALAPLVRSWLAPA
jgi:DNA-binding response OmpR family regulator